MEKRPSARKHRAPSKAINRTTPLQDFFDRFLMERASRLPRTQLGFRVIVDKRGFILTNNHVVDQATKIQVQLHGETTKYNAKVVGVDEETDLAVIKVKRTRICRRQSLAIPMACKLAIGFWRLAARLDCRRR